MRLLRMSVLAAAATAALAGLGPTASTPAAALPASPSVASVGTAGRPAAVPSIVHDVQYRRGRRGFPVYALGPYPSGFGDEVRTGRPFYAGRSYDRGRYYGYYSRPRYVERGTGAPCRAYARRRPAC